MKSNALALAACNAIVAAYAVETNTTAAPTAAPTPACTPGNWRTSYTNEHFELRWHCEACRPGTFSSTYNALKCVDCDDGKYSIGGLAACSDCPLGRYHPGNVGTTNVQADSEDSCLLCNAGQYNAWTGKTNCFHCPSGKYQDKKEYHVCHDCAVGQWTGASIGQSACVAVPTASPTPNPAISPTLSPTKTPTAAPSPVLSGGSDRD